MGSSLPAPAPGLPTRIVLAGGQLYLTVRTVESHRAHVQQKLRRSSRAELVRYALDHGQIDSASTP